MAVQWDLATGKRHKVPETGLKLPVSGKLPVHKIRSTDIFTVQSTRDRIGATYTGKAPVQGNQRCRHFHCTENQKQDLSYLYQFQVQMLKCDKVKVG